MSDLSRLSTPPPTQVGFYAVFWQSPTTNVAVNVGWIQAFFADVERDTLPQYIGTTLQLDGKNVWVAHPFAEVLEFLKGVHDDA